MSTEDNVLSVATAPAHVATLLAASKTSPFEPMASLVATEISDGNLNFAFCVADAAKPQCAVFLKQAPGYIKVLGPDYELSAARLNLEAEVLQAYSAAAPQHVPRLLARDEQFCTMVTEYLHGHELMRTALRERRCGVSAAEAVSQFMALTHASTWAASPAAATTAAATPSPSAWAHLTNESMCGITAAYVFSKPLDAADETNKSSPSLVSEAAALRGDQAFVNGVTRLRSAFLATKQCLVHGDLHTGSVMVPTAAAGAGSGHDGSSAAKVIDAEFAHFGCAAFDVGTFIAHLLFAAIADSVQPTPAAVTTQDYHAMVRAAWDTYASALKAASPTAAASDAEISSLLSLSMGFAGCELMRRVLGAAHVADLESLEEATGAKLKGERAALGMARQLVALSDGETAVGGGTDVGALLAVLDAQLAAVA